MRGRSRPVCSASDEGMLLKKTRVTSSSDVTLVKLGCSVRVECCVGGWVFFFFFFGARTITAESPLLVTETIIAADFTDCSLLDHTKSREKLWYLLTPTHRYAYGEGERERETHTHTHTHRGRETLDAAWVGWGNTHYLSIQPQ
jgi:hypothetical protein